MDKERFRYCGKGVEKFLPYLLLSPLIVRPKAIRSGSIAGSNPKTNKVIEITIVQSFDIQICECTTEFWVR